MNESLANGGNQQPLSRRQRADRQCDEFEREFKRCLATNSELPRIESYLYRADPADREHLLRELLGVEIELRRGAGLPGDAEDYGRRFAEYRQVVESLIDTAPAAASDDPYATVAKQHSAEILPANSPISTESDDLPTAGGRYQIQRVLGRGGFAVVYLARDTKLDRLVALKVPRKDILDKLNDHHQREAPLRLFEEEARNAAQLDHPAIVRVHDVFRDEATVCIVQEFIDGIDLASYAKLTPLTPRQCADLLLGIATALEHAHHLGIWHRDIKPQNILVDSRGRPHVADFGLSLHESSQRKHAGELAGTYSYMSPEQVRCEVHRLDGRTDLWSLGVILYELLTGSRPFTAALTDILLDEILHREPKPPRMINPQVPPELCRICLACLAKRATDRYRSAADLIADLQDWLDGKSEPADRQEMSSTSPASATAPVAIVPKGLRSYDASDAGFFLELLPGRPDRQGLPKSVRFWKAQLEQRDPDVTFTVGLMYGPTGCGKSSLVKAALLPRLSPDVLSICVEATASDTETRLTKALMKHCPELSTESGLTNLLARLRDNGGSHGRKVVLVLDQFEQWLQANVAYDNSQLIPALRQCDGASVQALVLVRDDFWMSATRFMQALEVPLVEDRNSAAVELFDLEHARKVLTLLGQAYGKLPAPPADLTMDQDKFLTRAVQDLAEEGKVVSVRLAMFAEMMKRRAWTMLSLREVGGAAGVGANFLEEVFSPKTAAPAHRLHQMAARAVLKALLPAPGTEIKGRMRSYEQLLEAAGYQGRRQDFGVLLRILDSELRLITPAEPNTNEPSAEDRDEGRPTPELSALSRPDSIRQAPQFYQLTHDYLISALREWLARKQRETRRGRAELRLTDRALAWNATVENRQLPSVGEFLRIVTLVPRRQWTETEQRMMRCASRYHLRRSTGILILAACSLCAGLMIRQSFDQARAEGLVNTLLNAHTVQVRDIIDKDVKRQRQWVAPLIRRRLADTTKGSTARLHLAFAMIDDDERQAAYLNDQLLTAEPEVLLVILEFLTGHERPFLAEWWGILTSREADPHQRRLRAAAVLARFAPNDSRWREVAPDVARQFVSINPVQLKPWQSALRPVAKQLVPPLASLCNDATLGELPRTLATSLVADFARDDPQTLVDVVIDADPHTFKALFPVLEKHSDVAVVKLREVLERKLEPTWNDPPLDPEWSEPDAPTKVAFEAAQGKIVDRFAFCQDMPWDEFLQVAETLRTSGYRPTRVRPWKTHSNLTSSSSNGSVDDGTDIRVAAIWSRDGKNWTLEANIAKEELPSGDQPAVMNGLIPADLAVLPMANGGSEPKYVVLWSEPANPREERRLIVDLNFGVANNLRSQGFSQCTIGVWTDDAGHRRYLGIWSNQGAASEANPAYSGFEIVDQPQWDVAVAPAETLTDPLVLYLNRLAQFVDQPSSQLDRPEVRLARAECYYQLGELEQALADLDFAIEKEFVTAQTLRYRAWTLARLGKAEDARAELAKCLEQEEDPVTTSYTTIVTTAWLGDAKAVDELLDSAATAAGQDPNALYYAVCAAALAAYALEKSHPHQAQDLVARSLELLATSIRHGYKDTEQLRTDADLVALHGQPQFTRLIDQLAPPARYAAVSRADVEVESSLEARVWRAEEVQPADEDGSFFLNRIRQRIEEGYRPVAIAVAPIERMEIALRGASDPNSLPPEGPSLLTCHLIFHRPLIPDAAIEELAQEQATAAAALLKLEVGREEGKAETLTFTNLTSLFTLSPDPRLRSYLLHRLAPYGVDPASLLTRLTNETDESRRRSLILGIGELAKAKVLTRDQQAATIEELARQYADDPDSGVHGAVEWTLRQLGAADEITRVRTAFTTGRVMGNRRWFMTKTGAATGDSLSLAIIDAREFLMGSPVSESERFQGPSGPTELRHRRLIGRRFALGMNEVTVAQFQEFRRTHYFDRTMSREVEAPANSITWYEAAEYCNWLSKQENIPREQWCYDPDQPFAAGMTLPSDYLQRMGYRLPTEAEWEYACRGGTTTARYFGQTETLLGEYAWSTKSSNDKWLLPVGSLKPNDFGLFDMQGNVSEWCQDSAWQYGKQKSWLADTEQTGISSELSDSLFRVLRGGSFVASAASFERSAARGANLPGVRYAVNGFRVARTFPVTAQ